MIVLESGGIGVTGVDLDSEDKRGLLVGDHKACSREGSCNGQYSEKDL